MTYTRTRMAHHLHTGWHEVVHWLYDPALMGRKSARVRFGLLHSIHLIPGSWMNRACANYDRSLGMSDAEILRTRPTGGPDA